MNAPSTYVKFLGLVFPKTLRGLLVLMVFWGFYDNSYAEGSGNWGTNTNRQSMLWLPATSGTQGYSNRGFMLLPSVITGSGSATYNSAYNPQHRLFVYVKQGETVFWGFRRAGSATGQIRVRWFYDATSSDFFPSGVSGSARTQHVSQDYSPSSTGGAQGRPLSNADAFTGPSQVTGTGYQAYSFVNDTGADRAFWVEITNTSNGLITNGFNISVFDVTVASGSPGNYTRINGRMYCKYWSIANSRSPEDSNNLEINAAGQADNFAFHEDFGFFVPIDNTFTGAGNDYFVKRVTFPGASGGWTNFFANKDGARNDSSYEVNRRSIEGVSRNIQYPLFINDPDPSIWITTIPPTASLAINFQPNPFPAKGGTATVDITISLPAIVDVLIDFNGNGVFDSGLDLILTRNYEAPGTYDIVWDGRDASGNIVEDVNVEVIAAVVFFPVHFPVFDLEQSLGIRVTNIRPGAIENNKIFWDDSLLPTTSITPANSIQSVIVNVTGRPGPDHIWWATGDNGFGNNMTINTWAASYYTEVKESFSTLPVSWLYFRGRGEENRVQLEWATAQERNNDYFVVERSPNGRSWEDIGEVEGVGDSEAINFYGFTDERPLLGNNFYRIRQVDRDRSTDYTQVIRIHFDPVWDFRSYPNPVRDELVLELKGLDQYRLALSDLQGRQFMAPVKNSLSGRLQLDMSQIPPGLYVVTLEVPNKVFTQRVHKVY